jgi:catechol 2,3-dioxygenase-like lactoylglutathione lyase family enzyme
MRVQLALNVDDLHKAIDFYSKLFGSAPAKVKPGYANWAIEDPPLKLVIFEGAGEHGTINHLGVETDSADEVVAADRRLREAGLDTTGIDETQCCFAEKTETWVDGVDGHKWEFYVKHADVEQFVNVSLGAKPAGGGSCCPS